jgi:hypothetical protein
VRVNPDGDGHGTSKAGTPDSGRLCFPLFRATSRQGNRSASNSIESQPNEWQAHMVDPLDASCCISEGVCQLRSRRVTADTRPRQVPLQAIPGTSRARTWQRSDFSLATLQS